MSMKRIITLFRRKLVYTLVSRSWPMFTPLIVSLSLGFTLERELVDHFWMPFWLDVMPLMIGGALVIDFIGALQLEKNEGTAEMLFSTPVTAMEYMVSLWLRGMVISILGTYLTMGIFAFSIGIERVAAHVSPLVWLQPPLLIIAIASGSGLILSIMLSDVSSTIKKIFYLFIIFAPIKIVIALVWIMFTEMFFGAAADRVESLPTWVSWAMETFQTVTEIITPSFIYSPLARWLPISIRQQSWIQMDLVQTYAGCRSKGRKTGTWSQPNESY